MPLYSASFCNEVFSCPVFRFLQEFKGNRRDSSLPTTGLFTVDKGKVIAVFGYATKIPRFSIDYFRPQSLQQFSSLRKTFETVDSKLLKDFSFLITRKMFVENDGETSSRNAAPKTADERK